MNRDFKTKFSDFKPEELIGKYVLFEYGQNYARDYNRAIRTIIKVTKTGFKISDGQETKSIFDFRGYKKGLTGRMNMGTHSICYLLTEDEAKEISQNWREKKVKREVLQSITDKLKDIDIDKVSLETLNTIDNLIKIAED